MKKIIGVALGAAVFVFALYQVITFVDLNFRYGRMWESPAVRPYEEPIPVMEPGLVTFGGGEAVYRVAAPADIVSPVNSNDPVSIAAGKNLYFTYCAQCHGKYHDGNGTVGQSFEPLPGDLRSPKVQAMPDGQIFKEVSYGIPGGRQPPLATTIAIPERWQIIVYVKSLGLRQP